MASAKEYGYFIKGSKLALIEKDTALDNDVNSRDYGPDVTNVRFKSPQSSVTDGIELEYIYSPKYRASNYSTPQINKFYINGWTSIDGYLTFLRSHSATVASWDASPYSAVGDDEFIVIRGSSKWNGLHKIQATGTDGTLKTYTRVNQSVPVVVGSSSIDMTAEEDTDSDGTADRSRIAANNGSNIWLNSIFSTGDYIFVSGSGQAVNNGFWKISDIQADATNEIDSGIYITNRYYCYDSDNTLTTEGIDTSPDTYATYDESVTIYKAYRDFCYLLSDVDTLNDEADELPLSEYLSKAVVYYLKAKMAEDRGDFNLKQAMMREFYRIVEKNDNAKIHTIRRVAPHSAAIR